MRRPFKMPPQVVRIVLLALCIVGSYAVARSFLKPSSFGESGWYRKDALTELTMRERSFAGKKACEECHSDEVKKIAAHEHKTLSCEGCHGPALAHADDPDKKDFLPAKIDPNFCLRCHEANPSRPAWHKQIALKTHYTGSKCTECHLPHSPGETP
jgi:hypothetical protein